MARPKGLGYNVVTARTDPASPGLSSATEELLQAPQPQHVGAVSRERLAQVVNELVPPPPWETDPSYDRHDSDARKFVKVPDNVTLRWINPKIVSQSGLRDWQAVPAKGDPRFVLKLKTMAAPDNTIRRGDHAGDFLAWMYTAWVESRNRLKRQRVERQTSKATTKHQQTQEAYDSGKFGRYIRSGEGQHPTHTMAEGRTMGTD
jgi:hypothetical protein